MNFWDFRRGLAGVRLLIQYGVEQGLDVSELLHGRRVSASHLADPNAEVTAEQELRVVENLVRLLRNPPGLGIQLGLSFRVATFGIWGYGLMSSATVGAALDLSLQFLPLTFVFSAIGYRIEGEEVVLRFVPPKLGPKLSRVLVERDMAAAVALQQQLIGESYRLLRFELPPVRDAPRPVRPLRLAGTPVNTAGREHLLAFDRAHLAQPLPQADVATAEMCRQMCAQLLERRRVSIGTAALVEHYLSVHSAGRLPSLSAFAATLNTSERTLKRRLQAEGTSFRDIAARLQAQAAAAMVGDASRTMTEVAELLGYADLASFSQAFKRWHGVSPSEFRHLQRGG
jgi:AraC-like DNA-binding protein